MSTSSKITGHSSLDKMTIICMNACQHLHTFIHSFFFSVDLAHPELLTEKQLWELNEKKHHYINLSFDISRTRVECNKNQGRHAWAKVP